MKDTISKPKNVDYFQVPDELWQRIEHYLPKPPKPGKRGRPPAPARADISHAMPGSREDVVAETKLRIKQLALGGGYILAPSNHLQADISPENVVALFKTAREFGKYPIQID